MARELHDSVGQYLAALGMSIEAARRSTKEIPLQVAEKLDEATEIVRKCSSEIRTLSHLLHPPLLEELGLVSAIEWYVEGFALRSNMEVQLELPPKLRRLDEPIELALFRVLQECLTNVHRHSGSKTAIVKVEADEHQVKLEVSDQGKGILQPLLETRFIARKRLGVGINGMRERLKGLDGTLEIHSTNLGTTTRAIIPLRHEAAERS
ncbi:MAG TPA: sensor histidine kinase [Candidatus Acidoferrales bacterium]|nr:sensor histidine kinase [Candidatus Acidoferrales bacterium]